MKLKTIRRNYTKPQCWIVINCRHHNQPTVTDPDTIIYNFYPPSVMEEFDRMIRYGELMFHVGEYTDDDSPIVRSTVSGFHLPLILKDQSREKVFWKHFKLVGVSSKDHVVFPLIDQPVAVISGLMTLINTGRYKIYRHMILYATLPPDEPNKCNGTAFKGESRSTGRQVLEVTPMEYANLPFKLESFVRLFALMKKHEKLTSDSNFIPSRLPKDIVEIEDMLRDTKEEEDQINHMLNTFFLVDPLNENYQSSNEPELDQYKEVLYRLAQYELQQGIYKEIHSHNNRIIGIAQSNAEMGEGVDVFVQPSGSVFSHMNEPR